MTAELHNELSQKALLNKPNINFYDTGSKELASVSTVSTKEMEQTA